MDDYQNFIALSKYARWIDEDERRETWQETVERYINYIQDRVFPNHYDNTYTIMQEAYEDILSLQVMPSMRALMTAGPALERCNVAGYNCAYMPVDSLRSFDEAMYILMCGTGVGYSVEKKYTNRLPIINEHFERSDTVIKVADSKAGWARSLRELITLLYAGQIPQWDVSALRPAGARLKTFGGRASGPDPLVSLFDFATSLITNAKGRRLRPIECHDLMCKIAEVVVVGGVRRSAMISLSDLDDVEMAKAKSGNWWQAHPYRALANNSAVYEDKPPIGKFLDEWKALYESGSGERGIFNRYGTRKQAERNGRRSVDGVDFGTNPCSEIILRPYQFCNLTEVVVRSDDTIETLKRKVRTATFLGTVQACLTDFKYLRRIWATNCEEERLLGVSLTGLYDNPFIWGKLNEVKDYAIECNKEFAALLGINQSCAITCVKPSGTVSQLVDSASGLHPRHSGYYIRTVRSDNKDPMTQFLKDSGVHWEPDVMKPYDTTVFSFYKKAPEGAITRDGLTAVDHLNDWLFIQERWCEHKPSVTINVKENEWIGIAAQVYESFDKITGVAFLPFSDHVYKQAPYQDISKEEYDKAPQYKIDWSKLSDYEKTDTTSGSQELACAGGYCEIVDISA